MLVSCSQACGCTPPLSDTFAASAFPYPICPLSCLEENGGFRSRDFLRLLRLASFRDCKFLDVGLKGAKTFAAKCAVAASSGFLSLLCTTYYLNGNTSGNLLFLTGQPTAWYTNSRRHTLCADTEYHGVAFHRSATETAFFRSVCNLIAVKHAPLN